MSENHQFNENRINADKRRCGLDLFCSLGEGMFAKENIETLRDSQGLTPLHPVSAILKNNIRSSLANEGFQVTGSAETLGLFSGYSVPLSLCGEIRNRNLSNGSDDYGFSAIETLRNSSGLAPLRPHWLNLQKEG